MHLSQGYRTWERQEEGKKRQNCLDQKASYKLLLMSPLATCAINKVRSDFLFSATVTSQQLDTDWTCGRSAV